MSAVKSLDNQIIHYLDYLSTEQKEVVLIWKRLLQGLMTPSWRDNDVYNSEMNKRFDDLEKGKLSSLSLDKVQAVARQSCKKISHTCNLYIMCSKKQ